MGIIKQNIKMRGQQKTVTVSKQMKLIYRKETGKKDKNILIAQVVGIFAKTKCLIVFIADSHRTISGQWC